MKGDAGTVAPSLRDMTAVIVAVVFSRPVLLCRRDWPALARAPADSGRAVIYGEEDSIEFIMPRLSDDGAATN